MKCYTDAPAVGQSFVYSGGGERAKQLRGDVGCFKGEAFPPHKANNKRHVGEKHKCKGLVMLHNTWPAAELSSLLDNAAQYKQE